MTMRLNGHESTPCFILCSPRSLDAYFASRITGLLRRAFFVPELNLFGVSCLGDLVRQSHGLNSSRLHGLRRLVSELYMGEQSIYSIQAADRWIRQRYHLTAEAVYREFISKLIPNFIVEKNSYYGSSVKALNQLADAFPDAYFIHLVRHPLGFGISYLNQRGGGLKLALQKSLDTTQSKPIVDPQIAWLTINKNISDFLVLRGIPNYLTIRVEDFYSSEHSVLNLICDRFEQLELNHHDHSAECCLFNNAGPFGAEFGGDIDFLTNPSKNYDPTYALNLSLQDKPPWRDDLQGLFPPVKELAIEFGYS